ncbi:MAG: SCP2 sterol-binding domain-containing protein [Candidatus Lokiarchaeota archaeon]|nr:SCP2 sterol-binding domain-containing protein [Candidatus Lokiarchaeota archaeon]
MVDQDLIAKLKVWRQNPLKPESINREVARDFISTVFTVFKQLSEEDEDLQELAEDTSLCMQIVLKFKDGDMKFWISAPSNKFEFGEGEGSDVTVTMSAMAEKMVLILSGELEATSAYMSGDLSIDGNLQDAMTFGEMSSISADLIDELLE